MTEIKSLAGAGLETAQNDKRKENLRKGLMIAGGVALAGVSIFAAMRGKKIANLQKELNATNVQLKEMSSKLANIKGDSALGTLIGENKAGLKLYKSMGQDGKEVLTTIDGKTGEVVKRITKQVQSDNYPWWLPEITAFGPVEPGKNEFIHIERLKTGETIDEVRSTCTWGRYPKKSFHVEAVHQKDGRLTKLESIHGQKNWLTRIFNSPEHSATEMIYMDKDVIPCVESRAVLTYKPFLEKFNISESMNQGYWKA